MAALCAALPPEAQPRWVKVGLELFLAEGPAVLKHLRQDGFEVFLDLKLHDIPNTVAGAIRAVAALGPALLTVHAGGGPLMLQAAAHAVTGSRTRLLAVTVLTSVDAVQLAAPGVAGSTTEQVERLAAIASAAGIEGFVCSPNEAAMLRRQMPAAHLVTPGIRPANAQADDQQRTGTPSFALQHGADQLVIGRPITASADPAAAYLGILHEIAAALPGER